MLLGRVTGTVVASRKEPLMEGWKLLVVRQLVDTSEETGADVVAADAVGAGVGEVVLYATGSSARQTRRRPGTGPATPWSWPSWTPGRSAGRRSTASSGWRAGNGA